MMQKDSRFVHFPPANCLYDLSSPESPYLSIMKSRPFLPRTFVPMLCCLALVLPDRVLSAEVLFFDDFTGPASDLASHSPKQGNSAWMVPGNPAQALQSDGDGRAVFDPESTADGKRKSAWVDTGSTGDEYYVAAECSIDVSGWAAVGFAEEQMQPREPLLASALFAVNGRGGWFLWVRGRNQPDSKPAFHGLLPPVAGFSPGTLATLSLLYNKSTGQLESYVNDHLVHAVTVSDLSLRTGSAVLAFHLDEPTDVSSSSTIYAESFLVSEGKAAPPSSTGGQ
jgi:hypothetical protein